MKNFKVIVSFIIGAFIFFALYALFMKMIKWFIIAIFISVISFGVYKVVFK